jgi:excisionase family DNA binding protein
MTTSNNSFSEALAAIFIPIVEEGVRRALHANSYEPAPEACAAKEFLTIEQAADLCGLGSSTIRLYIRKRKLAALKVGSRVLIKRTDLEVFLDSNRIGVMPNKFLT